MKIGYVCESCQEAQPLKDWVFKCLVCGKEICESCMYGYQTCTECAAKRSDADLQARYDRTFVEIVM